MSRLRPPAVLVLLALAAGCGARFYSPPSGAGVPAPDGSSALADATKDCRGIKTLQAAMRLSGRRLPSLNVMTGVTADGKLLLLVGATAAPDLWLAGTADAAILLLRDGNRVVRAHAADIVDALIDAPLGPEQLLAILSGCAARDLTLTGAIAYDRTRRITTPDGDLFVEQIGGAWRIVAAIVGAVRVDYRPIIDRFPTRISVRTKLADGREVPFRLDIQEALVDRPIEEKHFQLEVPAGAEPMTLDELRQMFSRR